MGLSLTLSIKRDPHRGKQPSPKQKKGPDDKSTGFFFLLHAEYPRTQPGYLCKLLRHI